MSRHLFEDAHGAMARAGVARLADAVFQKDGKQIPYRTVKLTAARRAANKTTPINFIMKDTSTYYEGHFYVAGKAKAQEESALFQNGETVPGQRNLRRRR
jgi:hypothetical protein